MCQNKISYNDWLERAQYLRSLAEEKVFRQMPQSVHQAVLQIVSSH